MKNLIKISLAITLASFLITSCNKNKDDQKENAITEAEMQNTANTYDEQGEMYNEFLNALVEEERIIHKRVRRPRVQNNWDVGSLSMSDNNDIGNWDVGHLSMSENNDIGGWDVGQLGIFAMEFYGSNGKDSSGDAKRILSMQLESFSGLKVISPHTDCWIHPDWCKDFTNPVEILDPSNGGIAHDRTIKYINAVRAQEAVTQKNDKLNQAEKEAFLICYSIARHAAGYWYNEIRNSGEPVGKITINMVHLSTLGASTAFIATDTKEVGVGTAILSAYVATGRAN